MTEYLSGASAVACLVISLYFLKFWRASRDRLFAIFSLAFAVFGVNRTVLAFLDDNNEFRTWMYVLRLLAFALILYAVIDKNIGDRRRADPERR